MKKQLIPTILIFLLVLGTLSTVSAAKGSQGYYTIASFSIIGSTLDATFNTPNGAANGPGYYEIKTIPKQNGILLDHDIFYSPYSNTSHFTDSLPFHAQPGTTYYMLVYTNIKNPSELPPDVQYKLTDVYATVAT